MGGVCRGNRTGRRTANGAGDKPPRYSRWIHRALQRERLAVAQAVGGTGEGFPPGVAVVGEGAEKEELDAATGRFARPEAPGEDTGVVGDQHVAGMEVLGNLAEGAVLERARVAVDDQQARGVARLDGCLRDALMRKVVGEVVGAPVHSEESRL